MKTINELLKAWDAGEPVWTIELGGLGPGYEQAIQVAAIEIARKLRKYKPTGKQSVDKEALEKICREVIHEIDRDLGGLSGAQANAAKWLAWQWCHNGGPAKLQERAKSQGKEQDCIMVQRFWPKAPEAPNSETITRTE